jgi:uncharacterized protein (TIGR02421 family)
LSPERLRASVREISDRIVSAQRRIRILDAVKWDEGVRDAFFAARFRAQPPVDHTYYERRPLGYDPEDAREEFRDIERDIDRRLGRTHAAARLMRRMCAEYEIVLDMLAARGTPQFSTRARDLYGATSDAFHPGEPSVSDLADMLDESLSCIAESAFLEEDRRDIPTEQAVVLLQGRLDRVFSAPEDRVHVTVSDGIVADAAAGSDYIKLRKDALFSDRDLRMLEVHEGWVHVGTTLNGRAQPICTFLGKGTPSTTVTQEGLALFVEVITFSSHPARLRRVTDRIRAIRMAERGATFLDVFRTLCDEGRKLDESYSTCMRVFRGSTPVLGPFPKDLSYSKGFVLIYNFIRLAVRRGRLDRVPLLFCGKLMLDEVGALAELVEEGVVIRPRFLPPFLSDMSALTAYMAYSSFFNRLDLETVEAEFAPLLR